MAGNVQHGTKPGKHSYLSVQEEDELVNFLLKCANIGYPKTIAQVLGIVQQTLELKRIEGTVSHGWWQRFCQRHTNISHRTAVPLSMARAMATDRECIDRYYDLL